MRNNEKELLIIKLVVLFFLIKIVIEYFYFDVVIM